MTKRLSWLLLLVFALSSLWQPATLGARAAEPSADEIVDYLLAAGYPGEVIERMDQNWRLNSYQLRATCRDVQVVYPSMPQTGQSSRSQQLQSAEFQETVLIEQWQGADGEETARVNYLWRWSATPWLLLTDHLRLDIHDQTSCQYPKATYTVSSDTGSQTVDVSVRQQTGCLLVQFHPLRSFREGDIRQRVTSHAGRIWFICQQTDRAISFSSRYHHQWLPALFPPQWAETGDGWRQWWAPTCFHATETTGWRSLPTER